MSSTDRVQNGRLITSARLLAITQGFLWFILLIFGGQGVLFGPMGVMAAVTAKRLPWLSVALLVVPTAYVAYGWIATFIAEAANPGSHYPSPVQMLPFIGLLTVPAIAAVVMLVAAVRSGQLSGRTGH